MIWKRLKLVKWLIVNQLMVYFSENIFLNDIVSFDWNMLWDFICLHIIWCCFWYFVNSCCGCHTAIIIGHWCVLKGVQQLGSVLSPGTHDANSAGIASMSCGLTDDAYSKASEPTVFSNRSSRLAGPGIGKPAFDSECGKKGSASRQRVWNIVLFK